VPETEELLTIARTTWEFVLPPPDDGGIVMSWEIGEPHEQVPGVYELQLVGPDGRVVYFEKFMVNDCPPPA
jgi:hypothetical protein